MHQIGVALLRDEILSGFRLAPCIDRWARLADRLGREDIVAHLVIGAGVAKALLGPAAINHIKPL